MAYVYHDITSIEYGVSCVPQVFASVNILRLVAVLEIIQTDHTLQRTTTISMNHYEIENLAQCHTYIY